MDILIFASWIIFWAFIVLIWMGIGAYVFSKVDTYNDLLRACVPSPSFFILATILWPIFAARLLLNHGRL